MLADTTLLRVRHVAKLWGGGYYPRTRRLGGGVIGGASASLPHELLWTSTCVPLCSPDTNRHRAETPFAFIVLTKLKRLL